MPENSEQSNNFDLVVVDADTLLFSAASVSQTRSILVTHEPTGIQKTFSTRTEFKAKMLERNKPITEAYSLIDVQTPEPVENCLHLVKQSANKIIEQYPWAEVVFVAGDKNNLRLDLPLPSKYKGQRKDMIRPVHLGASHEYLKSKFKSISADGYEVDDLTAIMCYDAIKQGKTALLLSSDKDSNQFVGLTVADYASTKLQTISEIHPVTLVKNKFKSYGIPWLVYQWLAGDASDCYKPTDLSKTSYGDVSAYKDLKDCQTAQEVLLKVVERYKQFYPDKFDYTDWKGEQHESDWKSMLMLYFKCAKMLESKDDKLCAGEFLAKYGVDL